MTPLTTSLDSSYIDFGSLTLLSIQGPDAIRFLNGQITQDAKLISQSERSLPSCITDAKGKLQFRVWISLGDASDTIWIDAPHDLGEALEQRIDKYLIADDAQISLLTGRWKLIHFPAANSSPTRPEGVLVRKSTRFGAEGIDWWIPSHLSISPPDHFKPIPPSSLENLRIQRGIPAWGTDIKEGMLLPETGLETSDVSYQKGCYIGQEIISRMKSAGKVNQRLTHFLIDMPADHLQPADMPEVVDQNGKTIGYITSITSSPLNHSFHAIGYLKRATNPSQAKFANGNFFNLSIK